MRFGRGVYFKCQVTDPPGVRSESMHSSRGQEMWLSPITHLR